MPDTTPILPLSEDPFFRRIGNTHWNACIGPQGDEENYVDGFLEAAEALVADIIDKKLYGQRDTLVMPILYTTRHGLELTLKFAINHLFAAGMMAQSHPANHDILSHWTLLETSELGDEAIRQYIKDLRPFVLSLSQIDEDGQELRYPLNRDGEVSLIEHPIANLLLIRDSLTKLTETVRLLKNRVRDVEDERITGTHTKDCSRTDLFTIAGIMPDKLDWVDPAFTSAKEAVMARFSLSSGKFSDAIKVILANREAKTLIGLESSLAHLKDESAMLAASEWIKERDATYRNRPLGLDYGNSDRIEEMQADRQHTARMIKTIRASVSDDEIADLETIFYIGRDRVPCEFYENRLASAKRSIAVDADAELRLLRILQKTNFCDQLRQGVRRLGHKALADDLDALSLAHPDPRL